MEVNNTRKNLSSKKKQKLSPGVSKIKKPPSRRRVEQYKYFAKSKILSPSQNNFNDALAPPVTFSKNLRVCPNNRYQLN